jgi:hypothetical protein
MKGNTMTTQTQPAFKVGDRVFSHYTMKWGTVTAIDITYRGQTHGVTGSPLPDTTWYTVRADDGSVDSLDDAHGDWGMARIVPPRIAKLYGYGDDPKPVTVCEWFALCDHEATGTMSHPVLGAVPICDRCRLKVEAL